MPPLAGRFTIVILREAKNLSLRRRIIDRTDRPFAALRVTDGAEVGR
jgi:hypothetical protein